MIKIIETFLSLLRKLKAKMRFKIKYHVVYDMDYGSSTKRYGDYILDNKNVKNPFEAENKVKELFMNGSDPDLNPYFNFTRGKILSKTIMIDQLELLKS